MATAQPTSRTKGLISWALYDWAHSAYGAIIQTFIFAVFFTTRVAESETLGTAQWGFAVGLAGFIVALFGPIIGAIADHGGRRKPWLFFFSWAAVLASAGLWFVRPSIDHVTLALILITVATAAAEFAFIFYNAMLPGLAPHEKVGLWSGMGWALGYVGGMLSLVLALVLFVEGHYLPSDNAANIRATFVLAALWFALFSLPLLLCTPDTPSTKKSISQAVRDGLVQLRNSLLNIGQYQYIVRFLIARMLYIDGLTTLFAFGGVYAAGTFGMDEKGVLLFGISLNIASGIGAALLAYFDDRLGGKKMILISLVGLIIPGVAILCVHSPVAFWALGLLVGVFVGPVQASSRSYMARISPPHMRNEMFGFFALSGKATAFLGPWLVGYVTYLASSQRVGMSVIFLFLFAGWLLMLTVPSDVQES